MTEVYQIDLDEELLSHLAIEESSRRIWAEKIDLDLIQDEFVKSVYEWQINHIREEKKPATASVLAEEFDLDFEEPLTAIGDLIDRIRDRWIKNNARSHMERVAEAYKKDPRSVVQVLPEVAREIVEKVGKGEEAYGTGDFDRAMAKYDQSVLKGPGPSFGFKEIDAHFHGIKGLCFGIAPPKTYKSWIFGVQAMVSNILKGTPGTLYSIEIPADETDMRIRCMVAGVPYWKYQRGSISGEDRKIIASASELIDDSGFYKCVKPEPGHRSFEEIIERAGDNGSEFIIVDQIQYVETRSGKQLGGCDPREYWQPINIARDLSDSMPIMCIHQFNRSVMNADSMPEMQQAKGAASIEETATLALGIWANKDMRSSNLVEIGTIASRNFQYESWEISVQISHDCKFEIIGKADNG